MKKNTFTEEEAINITIEHGYDGSEFNTAVWKKRGCLNPTRTIGALISKLETIYHTVEIVGRGKKRKYFLTDKKEEVTEREYNYKGTVQTEEEETMKEFIFNFLVKTGEFYPRSYKAWVREFNLFQQNSFSNEILIEEIKKIHRGVLYNPKEIVSEFINAINNYNKSLIENSFKRLENEGRITRSIRYVFSTVDGKDEEVDEEQYNEVFSIKKDIVESHDISYNQYMQAYFSVGHKNNSMKEIIQEVDEQMAKLFGIAYMYQAIGVSVINAKVIKEVSKEEFEQAYFQKFIMLAVDRQNRKDHQDNKSFWRRTYLMNTLKILSIILMDSLEVTGLEELLSIEMKRKKSEKFLDYGEGIEEGFEF